MKRLGKIIGLVFAIVLLCSFAVVNASALGTDTQLTVGNYNLIVDGVVDETAVQNAGSAGVIYDEETQTLSLNNYNGGIIVAENLGELWIDLVGTNTITSPADTDSITLYNTTLYVGSQSNGVLNINAKAEGIYSTYDYDSEDSYDVVFFDGIVNIKTADSYTYNSETILPSGIFAEGYVFVFDGKVSIDSAHNGINCYAFWISDGSASVTSRENCGIFTDTFTMADGNVKITSAKQGIYAETGAIITDGNLDIYSGYEGIWTYGAIGIAGGLTTIDSTNSTVMVANNPSDEDAIILMNPSIMESGYDVRRTSYVADGETYHVTAIGTEDFALDLENGEYVGSAGSITIKQLYPYVVQDEETGAWLATDDSQYLTNYTGFAKNENGTWYIENGKITFATNGVIYDGVAGNWKYVKGSQFTQVDTVANNAHGWWRIEDGVVNFKATGVFNNANGWWYCKNGQVQFNYTGIQNNANGWWRIVKGQVDFSATGVYNNANGWWYCKNGQVQFNYTGIQNNANGWWRIENGKVNFNFTGIASNENGKWYCKNGQVDFSKNGKVTYQGTTYTIRGGKVV